MADIGGQASSPVWNWRAAAADAAAPGERRRRAREAAAARRQGAIGGGVGLAVAAAIAWPLHRPGLATAVAAVALLVALLAVATPLTLYRWLRSALDRLGHWVGTAVTWLLMTLLFYLLFLPVGLAMRAMGKLALTRFAEPNLITYWTSTADRGHPAESYRKQF
jgi:hypothetical protein